ncbi:DUF1133 family protein, partial [Escherichia coli]|uniref:DUF1133 family protein n=1 Tax=Escherichia coli TaxID=562 RepID=UPI00403F69E7
MIYPTNTGKSGEHLRLTTLESVWIQGKLRMWGRWSYIGGGKTGNMFNQLLASKKLTKTAINEALRRMKKAGLNKSELEAFLRDMINGMAAVKISGVLKDGEGKPIQNCTIQLKAKRNSTTVLVNTVASENPDEAGRY